MFHSPRIPLVMGSGAASISGKTELRDYWTKALERSAEPFFELGNLLTSSDAITLLYTSHREEHVAGTFLFDDDGEVGGPVAGRWRRIARRRGRGRCCGQARRRRV